MRSRRNFFWCFNKKEWEEEKNCARFKVVDQQASPHGGQDIKISLVSYARSSGRGRGRVLRSNLLKKSVLFKIPDLVHMPTAAMAEIAARGRYWLPIKNMTPHYNSQFCFRKPANDYKQV